MRILILMSLCFSLGEVKEITGTGYFKPIPRNFVAVSQTGEVFVLDSDNRIRHFNDQGDFLGSFGGLGQGPGEYIGPLSLAEMGDRLYVFDFSRQLMVRYDLKGRFEKNLNAVGAGYLCQKAADLWVAYDFVDGVQGPARLIWFDREFKETGILHQWEMQYLSLPYYNSVDESPRKLNPVPDRLRSVTDHEKAIMYLLQTGPRLKISVIDLVEKKVCGEIEKELALIPFNKEWGEARVAQGQNPNQREVVLKAPDYFPLVCGFALAPAGHLVIERFTANPDKKREFLILDFEGRVIQPGYDPKNLVDRLIAFRKGRAFLTAYDADKEEGTILICDALQLDAVCAQFPIVYREEPQVYSLIRF